MSPERANCWVLKATTCLALSGTLVAFCPDGLELSSVSSSGLANPGPQEVHNAIRSVRDLHFTVDMSLYPVCFEYT